MHIGFDARYVQGPNTGVTQYILNLLNGISRIDKNNTYSIFLSNLNYCNKIPAVDNFDIKVNSSNSLIWKNVWLPKEIRRLNIDVVHFPAYTGSFVNTGKNVVTVHDVMHKVNPGWFSKKELILMDFPMQVAVRKATKIIAVSESTKRDIIKFYRIPEEKIAVTMAAVESYFKPINDLALLQGIKNKYKIGCDFILHVGVLFKRRNIVRLLEVFSLLKKDGNVEQKLVFVGPGKSYFKINEHIQKYKLDNDVIYLGYVEQEDMVLLYNAASFFVYPSLYEGFGLPVLEAMSCGKAVITSNISALPEVVGDAGLLIDPYNTQQLYDAMYRLVKDSSLRGDLGRKAYERSKFFSWEKKVRQTMAVYEDAVRNRR